MEEGWEAVVALEEGYRVGRRFWEGWKIIWRRVLGKVTGEFWE